MPIFKRINISCRKTEIEKEWSSNIHCARSTSGLNAQTFYKLGTQSEMPKDENDLENQKLPRNTKVAVKTEKVVFL